MTTASSSCSFSRNRTSIMQVSSGRPHMLTSNQRGRGNEPVVVLGRIRSAVAGNILVPPHAFYLWRECDAGFDSLGRSEEGSAPPGDEMKVIKLPEAVKLSTSMT